jgi:hypothetical protein
MDEKINRKLEKEERKNIKLKRIEEEKIQRRHEKDEIRNNKLKLIEEQKIQKKIDREEKKIKIIPAIDEKDFMKCPRCFCWRLPEEFLNDKKRKLKCCVKCRTFSNQSRIKCKNL